MRPAYIATPQDSLNSLRIDRPFVHWPGATAVSQVVKTEPLPRFLDQAKAKIEFFLRGVMSLFAECRYSSER